MIGNFFMDVLQCFIWLVYYNATIDTIHNNIIQGETEEVSLV